VTVKVEVKGAKELAAYLQKVDGDLSGTPMQRGMRKATLLVYRAVVKRFVPWQSPSVGGASTGATKASITPEVVRRDTVLTGIVGSNRMSAVVQETGSRPHWPPFEAVRRWAERHGTTAYVVARAIARRGNVARKQFTLGFNETKDKVVVILDKAVGRIIEQ